MVAVVEVGSGPGITGAYARAALGLLPGMRRGGPLPDVEVLHRGVTVNRRHLAAYDRVCGLRLTDTLPATYPQVLAFPLTMRLLTAPDFPLPLIGLIHIANRITVRRPIPSSATLDLTIRALDLRDHPRGRRFDVLTTASTDGAEVWRSTATYLRPGPRPNNTGNEHVAGTAVSGTEDSIRGAHNARPGDGPGTAAGDPTVSTTGISDSPSTAGKIWNVDDFETSDNASATADNASATAGGAGLPPSPSGSGFEGEPVDFPGAGSVWQASARVGIDYAAVSGDRNPIHTSWLGARLFGFPRPIAHGMWTQARALAALEGRLPDTYTVDVAFKKPLLLPSTVTFTARPIPDGWAFAVHPHLNGTVTSLP